MHLVGPAQVQVLADDFLEEDAAGLRSVEDLGQRELGLQDRDVVAVAGLAVGGGEGMRQTCQPLAQQRIDLGRRQAVAKLLQALGVGAGKDAVVQGLEGDAFLGQLPLDVFVAVDAQLGVVREVGAELQEERAEVFVDGSRSRTG